MVCGADGGGVGGRGTCALHVAFVRTTKLETVSRLRSWVVIRSYDPALRTCARRKNYRLFCVLNDCRKQGGLETRDGVTLTTSQEVLTSWKTQQTFQNRLAQRTPDHVVLPIVHELLCTYGNSLPLSIMDPCMYPYRHGRQRFSITRFSLAKSF